MSGPHESPPSKESTVQSETNETAPVSRRRVLTTTGIALVGGLAGCTANASPPSLPTTLLEKTVRLDPGSYESLPFSLEDQQWTTVSANLSDRSIDVKEDGPAVDVVVMSNEQYTQFQNEGTFEYIGGVSMPDVVNGEVSAMLEAGEYVLVVDHSDRGSATPGDGSTSVVKLEVTASDERR